MIKMKKILGILLALCFVLSVTAGAASAAYDDHNKDKKYDDHKKDKKYDHKKDKKYNHNIKKVYIPGHFEKKVVKKIVFKHGHRVVIKKIIKTWVPGKWVYVPYSNYHR